MLPSYYYNVDDNQTALLYKLAMLRRYKARSLEKLPKIDVPNENKSPHEPVEGTAGEPLPKSVRLPSLLGSIVSPSALGNITNGRMMGSTPHTQLQGYFAGIPSAYAQNPKVLSLFREFVHTYLEAADFFSPLRHSQIANVGRHSAPILLAPEHTDKVTLLFDLDETLIRSSLKRSGLADVEVKFKGSANTKLASSALNVVYVSLRPHLEETLRRLSEAGCFELGVFTASNKVYANPILKLIDPEGRYFQHRLYREHCSLIAGDVYTKDLRKSAFYSGRIKNRSLDRLLLVDNSPYSFANRKNAVPILSYHDDLQDRELPRLADYLLGLDRASIVDANHRYFSAVYDHIEGLA